MGGSTRAQTGNSSTIPYRVLVGSSIKRIDVHVLSRNPRQKTEGNRLEEFPSRSIAISGARVSRAFGKYQTVHANMLPSFYAFGTSDIRYSISRAYIHPRVPSFCSLSPRRPLLLTARYKINFSSLFFPF